jgi:hypothetical protein
LDVTIVGAPPDKGSYTQNSSGRKDEESRATSHSKRFAGVLFDGSGNPVNGIAMSIGIAQVGGGEKKYTKAYNH